MPLVGADDVRRAGSLSREILEGAADRDWSVAAGSLDWDCRATAGHIADALAFYAAHLGARAQEWLKFDIAPHADATNRHLARLVEAMAEVFAQVIEAAPAEVRAYHHSGMWDKETLAAFGCIEVLVHTGDIAAGLGISFEPSQELCEKVVARVFVGAPRDNDSWSVLWWATGRGELEGQPKLGPEWLGHWVERARA